MTDSSPTDDARAVLAVCRPLADVSPSLLDALLDCVHERRFGAGELLARQGDPGEGLFVIAEGTARATIGGPAGRHVVGTFSRGEVVGEMALVTGEARSADIEAEVDVRALWLPADDFHRLARRHPELGIVLTYLIADRLGHGKAGLDGLGGKTIDRYRVVRSIGRGGMAVVYLAEDLETDEPVALKMMSHRLAYDPTALRRFRQEAEVVQRLVHDNIARLYRSFAAYGTWFLVLEFCNGPDLARLVRKDYPLPEALVRPIIGQLARALQYVHARGVIHRDLKPSNALLDRSGLVKLTDFGIARTLQQGDETMTRPGLILGTPFYMAPEQMSGRPADARADIYALACMAYSLLAGHEMFDSDNLLDLVRAKTAPEIPAAEQIGWGASLEMHAFVKNGMAPCLSDRLDSLDRIAAWAGPIDLDALGTWMPGR